MSVLLETSVGDIVIDLETEKCPESTFNFLKLCKSYAYNYNTFFSVQRDFLAQTGDPSNTGKGLDGKGGGCSSIWNRLPPGSDGHRTNRLFRPEVLPGMKHKVKGTVSFACTTSDEGTSVKGQDPPTLWAGSQFFITLNEGIDYLDGRHAPFGRVVEGQEVGGALDQINQAFVDDQNRPMRDIRIKHVIVLDDPFPDPPGFDPPSRSPSPTPEQLRSIRLSETEEIEDVRPKDEIEASRREKDSKANALTLEMVGDLPFAEVRPPENILFVCKLNPVTRSDDLELIFSRFGKILSCEVIRDSKTGDSLQYAFIEFDKREDAERAYFKMQNVLVDDRRIWVDFSQSVSRLHGDWLETRRGGRGGGGGRQQQQQQQQRGAGGRDGGGGGRHRGQGMVFEFDERDRDREGGGRTRWGREDGARRDRDRDRGGQGGDPGGGRRGGGGWGGGETFPRHGRDGYDRDPSHGRERQRDDPSQRERERSHQSRTRYDQRPQDRENRHREESRRYGEEERRRERFNRRDQEEGSVLRYHRHADARSVSPSGRRR
ncbi:cyclophilin-like protein [Violaceomyces palustris]|uniref:Cyclophilin-like protein n=1 Tax=Violaceomyces palustris TaxID=1673888 RepID=A0ACD0P093_9BASI|nr:cyclophilin-like protein [Violaceomyces palustris]